MRIFDPLRSRIWLIAISSALFSPCGHAQDPRVTDVARLVSSVSRGIGIPAMQKTSLEWPENEEVQQLMRLTGFRRSAALHAMLEYTTKNEMDQLPFDPEKMATAAANLGAREISLSRIASMYGQSDDDVGLLRFIQSELADIRLVLDGRINYGPYFRARLGRDDIRMAILMGNVPVYAEFKKIRSSKDDFVRVLGGKTTALSLMDFCMESLDICSVALSERR